MEFEQKRGMGLLVIGLGVTVAWQNAKIAKLLC